MLNEGKDILVVDDEQNIRLMLRSSLEADGFAVREATTGEEAIQSIEREMPALVLLDLWMPQSNGMQVLEYLNQCPPEERPRVIVLTAHGRIPVVVKAMRLGASDFLEKPTTPEDLRLSVAAALEESPANGESAESADKKPSEPAVAAQTVAGRQMKYSPALMRLWRSVWNQDIHLTEYVLGGLFSKAWTDPSYFNLLGAVFEAEGNRGAARTFYQKAANSAEKSAAALLNLRRLDELEAGADNIPEVELGQQEQFLTDMCANRDMRSPEPTKAQDQHPVMHEGSHT